MWVWYVQLSPLVHFLCRTSDCITYHDHNSSREYNSDSEFKNGRNHHELFVFLYHVFVIRKSSLTLEVSSLFSRIKPPQKSK
jgi:hypothetical protein